MKRLHMLLVRIDYSFLPLDHSAKPIVPNDSPATEAPHEKKFKKNVDSSTWMIIRKGKAMPRSIRNTPRLSRKRGERIILGLHPQAGYETS